jgi:hypothetical protein
VGISFLSLCLYTTHLVSEAKAATQSLERRYGTNIVQKTINNNNKKKKHHYMHAMHPFPQIEFLLFFIVTKRR